jgi:hypothetical protein
MQKQNYLSVVITLAFAVLLSSCTGGSKVTDSWTDPSYTASDPVKGKVLVVGVARNDTHRHIFEDSMVANLQAVGVEGVASHTLIKGKLEPTGAAFKAVIKQAKAATVLVTHVIGSEEESQYFPAIGATFVDAGNYGGLHSYYPMVYNFTLMPAQNVSKETVTIETGLYDASNGQLIWIGRTEAVNPEMTLKYYTSLTKKVVRDLRKKNVL